LEHIITLKVAEAQSRDVGKAIVRMDQRDIQRLNAQIGGVAEIRGKSSAFARIMPAYDDIKGKGLIQMDGILRRNAGVGLDENVSVSPALASDAQSVTLSCAGRDGTFDTDAKPEKRDGRMPGKGCLVRADRSDAFHTSSWWRRQNPRASSRIMKDSVIKVKSEGTVKKDAR
jgi:transitional endoplasmic reticulum ATPase